MTGASPPLISGHPPVVSFCLVLSSLSDVWSGLVGPLRLVFQVDDISVCYFSLLFLDENSTHSSLSTYAGGTASKCVRLPSSLVSYGANRSSNQGEEYMLIVCALLSIQERV